MKFQPGFEEYFLSPVTGRILESGLPNLLNNYIFIGDRRNRAIQSPAVIDLRLELAKLRFRLHDTKFILQSAHDGFRKAQALDELEDGILKHIEGVIHIAEAGTDFLDPNLQKNNIWIGNNENKPFPNQRINNINLPPFTKVIQVGDNPISTTNASSTVRIATSNTSGLSVGAVIKIKGAQDIGGITAAQLNITTTITSINSGVSFSYVASGTATSTVSGGGGPNVSYYLPDASLNYGIYNLYTGGTVNTEDFTNDPGPVPTATLRIHQSNLPNLTKGRMFIGVVNSTQPTITINTTPPYFHVTGSLNWDALGASDNSHAVPAEIGLNAHQLFVGNSDDSGEITTTVVLDISNMANLSEDKLWKGNSSNRPIEITRIAIGNLPSLTHKKLWTGNEDNEPIETTTILIENLPDLTSGQIWRGNSSNRPEESADLSNLENRVTDIENELIDIKARIASLEVDMIEVQGQIAAIQAELVVIAGEIAALQAQVSALEAAVAILQGQVITLFAQVAALDAYVKNITLSTFVIGGPPHPTTGVITTARGPTCLLTNIPAGGNVSMDNYRITNLATFSAETWEEMEDKELDAINFLFLWQLLGGGTR